MRRLPIVNNFLTEHARQYDPERDCGDQCVICLEEFRIGDTRQIAELSCNSRHIFHLECLAKWAERNDVCPICREPILRK